MPGFWIRRRLPIDSKSTALLDNKSCVCRVVVAEHFPFELRICRFNHYPSMSFSRWVVVVRFDNCDDVVCSPSAPQSWHVVHVSHSMLLFFFHFASIILRRVVCPLRGLLRCLMCAFVLCFLRTN